MKTKDAEEKKAYYPNGWVIKTYKHMNIPKTDFEETQKVFKDIKGSNGTEHQYKDITYGTYDRIQMLPVDGFSDFIRESNKAYDWFGMSQAILLFPLDKEGNRHFLWGNDKNEERGRVFLCDGEGAAVRIQDGFYGTSFCYISDEIRNLVGRYDELMNHCNSVITNLVNAYNKSIEESNESDLHGHITAEVFGSLSAAELIIVWSAKQYTDILYLMDCIRDFCVEDNRKESGKFKYSLFRTTYTMISFFDKVKSDSDLDQPLGEILGHAHIQFVMQDGVGESKIAEFKEYLMSCLENSKKLINGDPEDEIPFELYRYAGEYDLIAYVESKYIPRLFNKPEDWSVNGWYFDSNNPDSDSCSLHHPKYNEYVLYSFTRLGYREENLPKFTYKPEEDKCEWGKKRKVISNCESESISGSFGELDLHRSVLINEIQKIHKKEFDSLITLIMQNVPTTSNLVTELNQLFSDYVQCCSSSADYVWIEDYNELFIHVLERVRESVRLIDVWKDYTRTSTANNEKNIQWRISRERLEHIRYLLKSLHQHTNHISASNKLFFREQKTHFGYTALHDLVIHAYYDIIKRLISYIYSYTDKTIQSQLYPLVDFTVDDRITSKIYSEESIEDYLKSFVSAESPQISPRIMVIQIPLDGMDNLMHYLPMLIHEVYHYAAPNNRPYRNQILSEVVTYQVLRFGLGVAFINEKNEYFNNNKKEKSNALKEFHTFLDPIIYEIVNNNKEAIYAGVIEDLSRICGPNKDLITEEMLLRNWFIDLTDNWLNNCNARFRNKTSDERNQSIYHNFADLFHTVFADVVDKLSVYIEEQKKIIVDMGRATYRTQYYKLLVSMHTKLNNAIESLRPDGDKKLASDDFVQSLGDITYKFVNERTDIQKLLEQFDEIFPDIAMVMHTQMPASGYMLQIALDMDKQLYNGKENETDQVRYVSVLNYLLKKNSSDKLSAAKLFKEELEQFKKMYIASYLIAAGGNGFDRTGAAARAEQWYTAFDSMYENQFNRGGLETFIDIYKCVNDLIANMESCLTLKEEPANKEQKELFAEPYKEYLDILKYDNADRQKGDLFKLSIKMIQKFQNYHTLKHINDLFVNKKPAVHVHTLGDYSKEAPFYKYIEEKVIISPDSYFTEVRDALTYLYSYRDAENISESVGMWFRGVANIDFPIVPSGFVHYAEDASRLQIGFPDDKYPCSYAKVQLYNYESFRYSAEGTSPGINPANYYQTINYLALMQHYEQHTNLVDWSEDYFGSSYFALEDEINVNDKYEYQRTDAKNFSHENDDAVMYILDPVRFNKACEEIEDLLKINVIGTGGLKTKIDVFNLSIRENQGICPKFHNFAEVDLKSELIRRIPAKDPSFKKKKITLRYLIENEKNFVEECVKLPRAVYVAKLNDRIRAQSGLFVIYNLESVPVAWEGEDIKTKGPNTDLFYYQSLESIQDYYLSLPDKHPFLIKIRIPKGIKKELGKMLYKCGISKEKVYPELSNYRHR